MNVAPRAGIAPDPLPRQARCPGPQRDTARWAGARGSGAFYAPGPMPTQPAVRSLLQCQRRPQRKKDHSIFCWHLVARGFHCFNDSRKESARPEMWEALGNSITVLESFRCYFFLLTWTHIFREWSVRCTFVICEMHSNNPIDVHQNTSALPTPICEWSLCP